MTTPIELPPRTRPRIRDVAVVLTFLVVLSVPGLAMLAGVRSPLIENRAAATVPPVAPAALADPSFYRSVEQAVDDAFPLRATAVGSRAAIDFGVLGGSTNPEVVVGEDRWLFLASEVFPQCPWKVSDVLAAWDQAASRFQANGVDARLVIAPDKRTAYPDQLPSAVRGHATCTDDARRPMRDGIASRPDTMVDLWGPVLDRTHLGPEETYFHADSHWTSYGAAPAIDAIVESLAPGLVAAAPAVRLADGTQVGDVSRLLGSPQSEIAPNYERPGVTVDVSEVPVTVKEGSVRPVMRSKVSGSSDVVPGTTLIVCDSFFRVIQGDLAPWFEDSVWVHIDDIGRHADLAGQLPPFDRIIVERGERLAYATPYEEYLEPILAATQP